MNPDAKWLSLRRSSARSRQRGATLEAALDSQLKAYNDAVNRQDFASSSQLWNAVLGRQLALIDYERGSRNTAAQESNAELRDRPVSGAPATEKGN